MFAKENLRRIIYFMRANAWYAAHLAVQYDYPRFDWSPGDDFAELAREINDLANGVEENT